MKLSEAREPIRQALERLLEKPRAHRPFVVVEDTVTGWFVQFAGSDDEALLFDVPQLGYTTRWDKTMGYLGATVRPYTREEMIDMGTRAAMWTLQSTFELPECAEIRIEEGVQTDRALRS